MSNNNMFNSVEEELWRIFTFYSLHTDPALPDVWRPANFVKFSKDCQITSKKVTATTVELEITRLSRLKSDSADCNPSLTINFSDFLDLLDSMSQKVYPRDPPQIAARRLILENVLLLANRRIPTNEYFDLGNVEANKVVNETFVKSLQSIFKHYLDQADTRRNQLVTAEKMRGKDLTLQTNRDVTAIAAQRTQALQRLKEHVKSQKDLISYKEYTQFCHDFNLKSTSLLTAVQVGEVFLNIVPFDFDRGVEQGLGFEAFCQCIVYMAAVAYRDCSPEVLMQNKVRALMLHMWKAVNDSDKTTRMVSSTRVNALTSYAGSGMNLFGCGLFSDQFLAAWMKDGFPDYSLPPSTGDKEDGALLVKKIVGDTTDEGGAVAVAAAAADGSAGPESNDDGEEGGSSKAPKSSSSSAAAAASSKEGGGKSTGRSGKTLDFTLPSTPHGHSATGRAQPVNQLTRALSKTGQPLNLQGCHLSQLFRLKPELTEFLYLEIQNMKLEDAMNDTLHSNSNGNGNNHSNNNNHSKHGHHGSNSSGLRMATPGSTAGLRSQQ